jgi:hypothetical protein
MRRIKHKKTATINPSINYTDWNDWLVDEYDNAVDLDQILLNKQFDDFISGTIGAGYIGSLGWNNTTTANGTLVGKLGELNHPGIITLSSGTTLDSILRIYLVTNNVAPLFLSEVNYFGVVVRPYIGTTLMSTRFGFFQSLSQSDDDGRGAYWSYNSATDAYWGSVTKDESGHGVGITRNSTNILYELNKWYFLEIKRNGTNLEFWLNNSLQFTHSTNLFTLNQVYPALIIQTHESSVAKYIDVDYAAINTIVTQRWT